jgi:acyl-CoA thioesterase FadM
MNLWFRLFLMLFGRPWRKPVDALATTVIRLRVWPLDLDLNRHVTNGRYFTLADIGRLDYVLRSGAFRVALRNKAVPIVGDTWGKFRRELKLFEAFEIHTRMLGWDEKWSYMEHRFVSQGRVVGVVARYPVSPRYFTGDTCATPDHPRGLPAIARRRAGSPAAKAPRRTARARPCARRYRRLAPEPRFRGQSPAPLPTLPKPGRSRR